MNVEYSEQLRLDKKNFKVAEDATKFLQEEVLGESVDVAAAKWDVEFDAQRRPILALTLSAWAASATEKFPPEVIGDGSFSLRLQRPWGKLLQIRSHRLLRDLQENATVAS